jgi:hypothetical protein
MANPPTWVDVRPVTAEVDVPDLIERLKKTTFYLDEALVRSVFARWLEP